MILLYNYGNIINKNNMFFIYLKKLHIHIYIIKIKYLNHLTLINK